MPLVDTDTGEIKSPWPPPAPTHESPIRKNGRRILLATMWLGFAFLASAVIAGIIEGITQ